MCNLIPDTLSHHIPKEFAALVGLYPVMWRRPLPQCESVPMLTQLRLGKCVSGGGRACLWKMSTYERSEESSRARAELHGPKV
jgi:hypothetical protein